MMAVARAALYTAEGTLMTCARHAERAGLRVVTMIEEDRDGPGIGLAGARLNALIDRLGDGEFEVIVADAGAGRVVTIAAALTDDDAATAVVDTVVDGEAPADGRVAPVPAGGTSVHCAIYVRCASPSQATPYPLADQWDACEAYAAEQGWETVAVYKDNAVSGMKFSRWSLDRMRAEAKRGAFDVLLVEDLSRLSRNPSHLHALLAEMKVLASLSTRSAAA